MPPFAKGVSGNPAGKNRTLPEIGAEISEALRALAGKQRPDSPRGTTWAQHLARQLWQDATRSGVGAAQAAVRLKTGQFIAERLEGRAVSPVELKAMIAQASVPQVVPWDDSVPGLDYDDADAPPAPELLGPVAGDAPPPERPAPPLEPRESTAAAVAPVAPSAAVRPEQAGMAAALQAVDPTGVLWNAMRASKGQPPVCPPWLDEADWEAAQGYGPSPSRPPVFGRPRARALPRRDGEHLTGAEVMARHGIVADTVDVDRRS